ncbi:hypothetical protein DBR43_15705 [Pedobacter sp. KBW06]|uniref:hypothetical protein n=1 Tax=Pedobacter sp. KBW06 TaxID=2153359 RepID=UPI000F5B0D27|nr:hypothetical protein [Pedobacter sp. KBW06]RQO69520.1 hypothetical protein DBR43_15705 [Pedobacter sp. KBW06]
MKKLIALMICSQMLFSCRQISKSVEETFKSNDSVANKAAQDKPAENEDELHTESHTTSSTTVETHSSTFTEQHVTGTKTGFLTDIDQLTKAENELRKLPQYRGKEIFIYTNINFYDDGRITAMLQHPQNPKYVDSYEYNSGNWSAPKPKQLSVKDEVKSNLVSLNNIPFSNVAKVTGIYNEKAAHIEGAKPSDHTYIAIFKNRIEWYPMNINGTRERYYIQFNPDGTLKEFRQD